MGLDFLDAVSTWTNAPAKVFLDRDTLAKITNPVNLHMHHHEELIGRTESEIIEYKKIMSKGNLQERKKCLQEWYDDCIRHATTKNESTLKSTGSLAPLDMDHLCSKIEKAMSVRYFGGSSQYLLQRLIKRGFASKIKCHMQAVRFNSTSIPFEKPSHTYQCRPFLIFQLFSFCYYRQRLILMLSFFQISSILR
jgi:hypothetical protein